MASLNITDGTGKRKLLWTESSNPNLIGCHYFLNGIKVKTLKDALCQTYLHYLGVPGRGRVKKEPIPKGTELKVEYFWRNFYGAYFNVKYNGEFYDLSVDDVKVI